MKVAIIFDNFGPYHLARLKAASTVCTLFALEVNQRSRDYAWQPSANPRCFHSITFSDFRKPVLLKPFVQACRIWSSLTDFSPDCVFVPGWSRIYSLQSLRWCKAKAIPAVIMSETTESDALRSNWKEWLKSRIVRRCSAALVGGTPHAEYIEKLGMPPSKIFQGYDVIDNDYFRQGTQTVREGAGELRRSLNLPAKYFLASARFIEKKNLSRLIIAFAKYRRRALKLIWIGRGSIERRPWSLVLLGDGEQKVLLRALIRQLGLEDSVLLPGFKQYEELPVYYGLAEAFVHASTSEPWGLVVNEAMASGLPVLVSSHCGCAADLVREGGNGFTFDPENVQQLAALMLRLSQCQPPNVVMGKASAEIISDWGPLRFARAVRAAAEKAAACAPLDPAPQSRRGVYADSRPD
jgi:1,2-diacylglycerol 3-alpha-glucosyltransferase